MKRNKASEASGEMSGISTFQNINFYSRKVIKNEVSQNEKKNWLWEVWDLFLNAFWWLCLILFILIILLIIWGYLPWPGHLMPCLPDAGSPCFGCLPLGHHMDTCIHPSIHRGRPAGRTAGRTAGRCVCVPATTPGAHSAAPGVGGLPGSLTHHVSVRRPSRTCVSVRPCSVIKQHRHSTLP